MCLKSLIANKLVKPFKAFPYFGRFRFWCLYWAYALTGWHIRHREWQFVLEYLPPLMKGQKVAVYDVGCSRNLFCHEVVARRYELSGIDLECPSFKYPGIFTHGDIRGMVCDSDNFDFVTCISVLEHIEEGQVKALENMIRSLKIGGRLLLTIPTHEFAQGHPWHGFRMQDILKMNFNGALVQVLEYTELAGQICLAIERIA